MERFSRLTSLIGLDAIKKLENSKVVVFGIGGVGGYVVEALARSSIGYIEIVDNDIISTSNINRQIIATEDTVGQDKCETFKNRILSINPNCVVNIRKCFYLPDVACDFDFKKYDYVVDCVDTVSAKISIIENAYKNNVKVISAMGAGNKMNPTMLEVDDIYKTSIDPLARVIRGELKKRGIKSLKVVYSKEQPIKPDIEIIDTSSKKRAIPGSNVFVPGAMGLIIASEVVKDLI